jgi:hypothetical protein
LKVEKGLRLLSYNPLNIIGKTLLYWNQYKKEIKKSYNAGSVFECNAATRVFTTLGLSLVCDLKRGKEEIGKKRREVGEGN